VSIQDLTKRELEVLQLISRGKSGAEIREVLGVTENTLKTHTRKLFQKLDVNSRAEALRRRGYWYHESVDYALQNGLMGGGLFGPNENLSRAQAAQMLMRHGKEHQD